MFPLKFPWKYLFAGHILDANSVCVCAPFLTWFCFFPVFFSYFSSLPFLLGHRYTCKSRTCWNDSFAIFYLLRSVWFVWRDAFHQTTFHSFSASMWNVPNIQIYPVKYYFFPHLVMLLLLMWNVWIVLSLSLSPTVILPFHVFVVPSSSSWRICFSNIWFFFSFSFHSSASVIFGATTGTTKKNYGKFPLNKTYNPNNFVLKQNIHGYTSWNGWMRMDGWDGWMDGGIIHLRKFNVMASRQKNAAWNSNMKNEFEHPDCHFADILSDMIRSFIYISRRWCVATTNIIELMKHDHPYHFSIWCHQDRTQNVIHNLLTICLATKRRGIHSFYFKNSTKKQRVTWYLFVVSSWNFSSGCLLKFIWKIDEK